jgi:hypothetical protein
MSSRGRANCVGKRCFSGIENRATNGDWWNYETRPNPAPCVKLQPRLLFKTQSENFFIFREQPVEGSFKRAPYLRALQSRDAAGRDSRDLQT